MSKFFRLGSALGLCILAFACLGTSETQIGVVAIVGAAILNAIDDVIDSLDRAGRKTDV